LLDPAEELNLHWPNTGGSNNCHLRHLPESPRGADLRKSEKKYANMTGQSTSRLMSRPRLKVRAAPSMNKTRRSNDCLCSHQRISKPIQSAISLPAATGPMVRPQFKPPPRSFRQQWWC